MNCANIVRQAFLVTLMSCDNPTLIKNPYYKKDPSKGLNFLHDCHSQYMRVPCGHCPSCIATKQMYILQRFYMEQLDSYVFFSTFTYDNKHLPTLNVNGYNIRYADFKHFRDMVKRIRKYDLFTRPFSYFAVSELGSTRGRPHFHCLWFLPKYIEDSQMTPYRLQDLLYTVLMNQWKVRVSESDKFAEYEPLFEFHCKYKDGRVFTNFDLHYVTPNYGNRTSDSVAFYVMKYLLKTSERERKLQKALKLNLPNDEYKEVWNKVHSRSCFSKHFGYGFNLYCNGCSSRCHYPSKRVLEYIRDCIHKTPKGSPYPCFFSPLDGSSFPLAPYYQSNKLFYTFEDALPILLNSKASICNDLSDDFYQKARIHFDKFQKVLRDSELHGNPILFD